MGTEGSSQKNSTQTFFRSCEHSIAAVLTQALGARWSADTLAEFFETEGKDPVGLNFTFSKGLHGAMRMLLMRSEALNIALKFIGQDVEGGAWNEQTEEALDELLRQIVGQLKTTLEREYGEIAVDVGGTDYSIDAVERSTILLRSANGEQARITILVNKELLDSLANGQHSEPPSLATGNSQIREQNLKVLMGICLAASLRFGKKQLLLRDLLELNSGSVIELDRQVQEPVDLVLDGKLIARGEVVVVDGCYGLRITEVASQRARAELIA